MEKHLYRTWKCRPINKKTCVLLSSAKKYLTEEVEFLEDCSDPYIYSNSPEILQGWTNAVSCTLKRVLCLLVPGIKPNNGTDSNWSNSSFCSLLPAETIHALHYLYVPTSTGTLGRNHHVSEGCRTWPNRTPETLSFLQLIKLSIVLFCFEYPM